MKKFTVLIASLLAGCGGGGASPLSPPSSNEGVP
jgi:hypothetical protein